MIKLERVDSELQKAINEIVCHQVKDPRLDNVFISVTEVNTTKDLKYAKVFVSIMPADKHKEVIKVLNSAASFIRSLLFDRVKLRMIPALNFYWDDSMEKGMKIDALIRKINTEKQTEEDKE